AATRTALRTTIDQDSSGGGIRTRGRLQGVLVGVQVAFSMMLAVATALLLRGFYETLTIEPDFVNEGLVVVGADLGQFGYDGEQAAQLQQRVINDVATLPGVDGVAQVLIVPYEGRHRTYGWRLPEEIDAEAKILESNTVSANYFSVTGIPIVRGRTFTDAEIAAAQSTVAIMTESTARLFWPGENAIGKTVISGFGQTVEIVGIAGDVEVMIGETNTPYIYSPAIVSSQPDLRLVIRSSLPPEALKEPINGVYERLDPRLPVDVRTFDEILALWTGISSLATSVAFGLGALALVLASIGVYGVMTMVVGRRVREIGIRLALGARKTDVLQLMLEKSMRPVVIGAAVGILACFGVARLLTVLLFGVGALDPFALAGAATAVLGAGFLASAIPARRAMRVDPMTTLRYE
ncbi:MAG: ABC transporter permease, partial [Gammaproteobacteria bacterium]